MLAEANFTPTSVRVPADNPNALWLRFGTVRYDFGWSLFFKGLGTRFVPVRFPWRRYGTVHPSIRGCTRTTPVPPDPYRRAQPRGQVPVEKAAIRHLRGGAARTIDIEPVGGARP